MRGAGIRLSRSDRLPAVPEVRAGVFPRRLQGAEPADFSLVGPGSSSTSIPENYIGKHSRKYLPLIRLVIFDMNQAAMIDFNQEMLRSEAIAEGMD